LPANISTSFEGSAQVFQQAVANQGMLLFCRRPGDLHHPRHPFTRTSSTRSPSCRALPSAGIGALITLQLFWHGPQRHRRDRRGHADRHRQEERHHDGGLCRRTPCPGAPRPRISIVEAALLRFPPDHDDHDLCAARLVCRSRSAPVPAPSCASRSASPVVGRPHGLSAADAVHHAGRLHLVRQAAGREVRRDPLLFGPQGATRPRRPSSVPAMEDIGAFVSGPRCCGSRARPAGR